MEKIFYPLTQRRLRTDTHIRELTASVKLSHKSFIQPFFVDEGINEPRDVNGLNGVQVDTIQTVLKTIEECVAGGINKVLLFPVPVSKTEKEFDFSFAVSVIKRIRKYFGEEIWIASDLCLCSYTTHGHCGILNDDHSKLVNHSTVDVLSRYAIQLANAGVNFEFNSGEVHALMGENGAGKSTLMRQLYGLYQPDEGSILIDGQPQSFRSPADAIAQP